MKKLLIVVFLPLYSLSAAWVRPASEFLVAVDTSFISAKKFYDSSGNVVDSRNFSEISANLYAEAGVTSFYTTGVYFPALRNLAFKADDTNAAANFTGVGDVTLLQKLQFFQSGGLFLNFELLNGIPTGNDTQPDLLLTGDGEFNFLPRLALAYVMGNWFFTLDAGYNFRTREFSDEIHVNAEVGVSLLQRQLFLIVGFNQQSSLKNRSRVLVTPLISNETSFSAYSLRVAWQFAASMGINASMKSVFAAENIIAAPAFSVGYFVTF